MSQPSSTEKGSQAAKPKAGKEEDALIFTPVSIARARHASAYGPSIIDPESRPTKSKSSSPTGPVSAEEPLSLPFLYGFFKGSRGCLIFSLLTLAFLAGGMLGGLIGGGVLLWANNSGQLALLSESPTTTPQPTPTPAPAETATPTSTPLPAATPSPSDIIERVIPSVVTVVNQQRNQFNTLLDEGRVVGSGVIIDSRGYIATNNHVVDHPGELKILLWDGRELIAELVAANPAEDLAILKIDSTELPTVQWGDSSLVRPGQIVYAIGSPLGDFPNSVSFGIVSGLNRALEIDKFVIDGLIQTDAAINRGSSGGPLINPQGQMIGINTFIIRESEERGIAEGIAFSIPAKTAKNLLIPWIAAHAGESVPIPAAEETE